MPRRSARQAPHAALDPQREARAAAETCRHFLDAYGAWAHGHQPARHHRLWIERVTALVEGQSARRKLLLIAPPGSAKSTWLSLIFPCWYLGRHPDHSLLFFTSSDTNAVQFGRTVKATLEGNERHALTFPQPDCRPDTARGWSGDGLYLGGTPAGSKDPAYRSVGYGASVIGARAHGIVLDDPLTQQQAQSASEQLAAKEYHDLTVDSRLHPDGWAVAIMTAWHELDLRAHLAEKPEWDVVLMPALGDYPWGPALWPERFSEVWLEAKRREIGGPRFQCIYQGDPTSLGGEVFREAAWFKAFPEGFDLPDATGSSARDRLTLVQYYDLAFSARTTADYTAGVTVGRMLGSEQLYVTHAWRTQVAEVGLAAALAAQIVAQRPALVGIEEGAFKQAATRDLLAQVRRLLQAQHVAVPVLGVKVTADKVFRARLPAARAEAGQLYVDKASDWAPALIAECLGFPRAAHDDWVDALAGACQLAIEHTRTAGIVTSHYTVSSGPPQPVPSLAAAAHLRAPEGTPGGAVNPWTPRNGPSPEEALAAAVRQAAAALSYTNRTSGNGGPA